MSSCVEKRTSIIKQVHYFEHKKYFLLIEKLRNILEQSVDSDSCRRWSLQGRLLRAAASFPAHAHKEVICRSLFREGGAIGAHSTPVNPTPAPPPFLLANAPPP